MHFFNLKFEKIRQAAKKNNIKNPNIFMRNKERNNKWIFNLKIDLLFESLLKKNQK